VTAEIAASREDTPVGVATLEPLEPAPFVLSALEAGFAMCLVAFFLVWKGRSCSPPITHVYASHMP